MHPDTSSYHSRRDLLGPAVLSGYWLSPDCLEGQGCH